MPGVNSRFDELQAAFLRVKLAHLDEWNARRKKFAVLYLSQLSSLNAQPTLPHVPEWAEPVWHLFVVQHPQRDRLQQQLADQGVQTIIHYPVPTHWSGAYEGLGIMEGGLPICERLSREVLNLPIGPQLIKEQSAQVVLAMREFLASTGD